VFCGSNPGSRPQYQESAAEFGRSLLEKKFGLVYGGGIVGLMGVIAATVLDGGGEVTGVIPEALATRELAHPNLTVMHVVRTMHERKAMMARLSDAFIALPGGYGTFEELLEIITWAQLGLHRKPIGLLNVENYFTSFVTLVENAVHEGFIRPEHRGLMVVSDQPRDLLLRLTHHQMPPVRKWVSAGDI
jgi:uncharacterized protein (TIGR00730 family)